MTTLLRSRVSRRSTQALLASLLLIILAAVGLWVVGTPDAGAQANSPFYTLRVYGRSYFGAGADNVVDPGAGLSAAVFDPVTGAVPEDAPYTDLLGVFHPQHPQAPRKDHVTWNPAYMAEGFTFDENQRRGLYNQLFANGINIAEKVWHRHWYEPEHWDKDLNADGRLTRDRNTGRPLDPRNASGQAVWFDDIWYPAIMQEFTYMLMENQQPIPSGPGKPEPLFGGAGQTSFVFPVGMRGADLLGPDGAIDSDNGANDSNGYGLTSLDANFDGAPDIVHVDSELTLFEKTGIAADFNGDSRLQGLRVGSSPTPDGTELAVMHVNLSANPLRVGQYAQFLDHAVRVAGIFNESVVLEIWYTGDLRPRYIGQELLYIGDLALSGTNGPAQVVRAVRNGGPASNLCTPPVGPWFAYVETVDTVEGTASIWLGRGLGHPFTGMEDGAGVPDRRGGDPWFLKRFYVDGHEYNVVALAARGNGAPVIGPDCDLRDGGLTAPGDPSDFSFITLRTPTPKGPDILIAQHSVRLKGYGFNERLAMLPPYNYEHYIFTDILSSSGLTPSNDLSPIGYIGPLVGPVPPILQNNGPFPYVSPGGPTYSDPRETSFTYRRETTYPDFLGGLRELYGETPASEGGTPFEFFFTEQFWTVPWAFTEFALPDIAPGRTGVRTDPISGRPIANPDLYLLTSAFQSDHAQYQLWVQDQDTPFRWGDWSSQVTAPPVPLQERVKFWFDPASSGEPNGNPSGKVYKDGDSLRIYGKGFTSNDDFTGTAGDLGVVTDPISGFRVEVPPYTDPWAPFNPQLPQAPRKDSITFNPVYMDEFRNSNEPLAPLYGRIAVEDADAREKVYQRMWYENSFLDKLRFVADRDQDYRFSALVQEFTYLLLDTQDRPTHGQPGNTRFVFPMATDAGQLPLPPRTAGVGWTPNPSFGYGLTSFDANFDGTPEIVAIDSERSLFTKTGIQVDFNGNGGAPDNLRPTGLPLDGLVVFSVENIVLKRGQSAQFLDHLVTLENIGVGGYGSAPSVDLDFWYTGGGLHPLSNGQYSSHPDFIRTASFNVGDMAIAQRNNVRRIPAGGTNIGRTDGAWFAYVKAVNQFDESVVITVGRALGATHAAIDNGQGGHNMAAGTPWYLKRFFVDGHEYNVVAVQTVPSDTQTAQAEPFEFKYITIRTPVPKPNSFVNYQDSIVLQGYFRGPVLDNPDTNIISVMPPYNVPHTIAEDIVRQMPAEFASDAERRQSDCVGPPRGAPALGVRVTGESGEPRFLGEIRELLFVRAQGVGANRDVWSTEQYQSRPDRYTDVRLPGDQNYLLTSSWTSTQSRLHFFACGDINPLAGGVQNTQTDIANAWSATNSGQTGRGIPAPNTGGVGPADLPVGVDARRIDFFNTEGPALAGNPSQTRVKLVYNPRDPDDIYVNPAPPSPSDPTFTPTPTSTATRTATATPSPTGLIPPTRTPTATATGSVPVIRTSTPTATGGAPATRTPTPTGVVPPTNKPTGLACVAVSLTQINLQWTNNGAYSNVEVFRVPAFPGGSSLLRPGGDTSYSDTGLTANMTYRYQVRGIVNGVPTDLSNATECTTPNDSNPPPTQPPTQLSCVVVSPTQINLQWVNGAVYSNLELARVPAFPGGSSVLMLGGFTNYADTALMPGTTYRYQIRGFAGSGWTSFSNVTECRTLDDPNVITATPTPTATGGAPATRTPTPTPTATGNVPPPNKPTSLACIAVSPSQINLQWVNNGAYSNVELFRVPAFPGGSSLLRPGGDTSYSDTGLTANMTYRYQVRGIVNGVPTDLSNATECTTPPDSNPPPIQPPTQLSCVAVSPTQINLQWTNGMTYSNVELFRAPSFPGGSSILFSGSPSSFNNTGLSPNTTYRYQVRGVTPNGVTQPSNVAECTTPGDNTGGTVTPTPTPTATGVTPPPTNKPTGLACVVVGSTQINLQWVNNGAYSNVELFRVPAFPGGSSVLLPGSATSQLDTGLTPYTTYRYQVRGIINGVPTDLSNATECRTLTDPTPPPPPTPPPSQLACVAVSNGQINLQWTNGAAYSNVELFRAPSFPGGSSLVLSGSPTSYPDGGLLPNTVYRYQVRGWLNGSPTDLSNVTECSTLSVVTSTPTPTATFTGQPPSNTRTPTPTATFTGQPPSNTRTPTPTATFTGQPPSATRTPTPTPTATGSVTPPPNLKPTGLVCAAVSATQINLQWLNNSVYSSLELARTPAFPGGSSIQLLGSSTLFYDTGLQAGQTYRYQVRGIINGQPTDWSNPTECTPPADPPAAPQISCHVVSYSIIDVTMTVGDPSTTSLRLERSRNDVNWTEIAIVPSTQTTFRSIGLYGNTTYFFRARAYRSSDGQLSDYTTSVACHTPYAPNRDDVTGTVHLQGRVDNSGARVLIDGGAEGSDITDENGYFSIAGTTYGEHTVEITMDGYLPIRRAINVVSIDTPMGDLYMIAGDANRDNIVNLFDLTIVGSAFDTEAGQPRWDEHADINGDGVVNLFDLVLVSNNFDKVGPTDGSAAAAHGQTKTDAAAAKAQMVNVPAAKARLVASPQKSAYTIGDLVTVAVEMDGLTDFMGAELNLSFNPAAVQVVDTDAARAGVQVRAGSLFPAGESMIVQPEAQVDNTTGKIRFVATRLGQETYTGSGTLVFITFRVAGCSPMALSLSSDTLKLANAAGELPYEVFDGQVDIRSQCVFLPLIQSGN